MERPLPLVRFFAGVAALALVPFLVLGLLSDADLLNTFEAEANRISQGRLEDARAVGAAAADQARSLGLGLALDPALERLAGLEHLVPLLHRPNDLWFLREFQEGLEDRIKAQPLVLSVRVDLEACDYLIDSDRGTFLKEGPGAPSAAEGWAPGPALVYRYPLTSFLTSVRGTVEVSIDEGALGRALNRNPATGTVALVGPGGLILSHPNPALVGTPWQGRTFEGPGGSRMVEGPGGRVLQSWLADGPGGWVWAGEFPLQDLTRALGDRRTLTLVLSTSILAAALGLAFWAARRGWSALARREAALVKSLQEARDRALDAWILTGLEGAPGGPPPEGFSAPWLQALLVVADQPGALGDRGLADLLAAAVGILGEAGLPGRGVLRSGSRLVLVLNLADPQSGDRPGACRALQQAAARAGTTLTLCWGSCRPAAEGFSGSWAEAVALEEVRFLRGGGLTLTPADLPLAQAGRPLAPDLVPRLLAAVDAGRPEAVGPALDRIASHIRFHAGFGQGQGRLALTQVAAGLLAWMADEGLAPAAVWGPSFHLDRDLAALGTLDEAARWLHEVCQRLARARRGPGTDLQSPAGRLMALIQDHYRSDLGIEGLAGLAGLSPSHARRVFHREVGASLLDTVNRLRLGDAAHLLKTTDLPLAEVARTVGYRNTQSLQRLFRKFSGTSPGDYRRVHRPPAGTEAQAPVIPSSRP